MPSVSNTKEISRAAIEYRLARAEDNAAILGFMAMQPMSAGLQMRFDRSPDFFALSGVHGDEFETHLFLQSGEIVAIASLVIRDGYINEKIEPIVYLCDLRIQPSRQIAGRWHSIFAKRMNELADEMNARYAFTVIMRDNHSARNALLRRDRFGFEFLRGFHTVAIVARKPWVKHLSNLEVKHAEQSDIAKLQEFLHSTNRKQQLGTHLSSLAFEKRLLEWPNLTIEDFLLAFDANGDLVGCLAPWDYSPLKRIVIDSLPPGADVIRRVLNLSAPLTGRPIINKPPNAQLPDVALTHLALMDRRPDVLSALLYVAVAELCRKRSFATISLCLYDDEPLWSVLQSYWYHSVPMDLYSVGIKPETETLHSIGKNIPGFEFYLA